MHSGTNLNQVGGTVPINVTIPLQQKDTCSCPRCPHCGKRIAGGWTPVVPYIPSVPWYEQNPTVIW